MIFLFDCWFIGGAPFLMLVIPLHGVKRLLLLHLCQGLHHVGLSRENPRLGAGVLATLGSHGDITNNYGDLTNNYGDTVGLIVGYNQLYMIWVCLQMLDLPPEIME